LSDIFEMPRNILDLTISKNIGEKLVVKFGISDILNQNQILLQDDNQDGKYERNVDRPIQRFSPGTVYTAGFSFRLN
jgi:hypothetical protein